MKKFNQYKPKETGAKRFKSESEKRNTYQMGYDNHWRKYKIRFLQINPKCYVCGQDATVVDHYVAHKGDMVLFKRLDNHIPLCEHDHNRITGLFDRHEIPKTKEKYAYMKKLRLERNLSIKIKRLSYYS